MSARMVVNCHIHHHLSIPTGKMILKLKIPNTTFAELHPEVTTWSLIIEIIFKCMS